MYGPTSTYLQSLHSNGINWNPAGTESQYSFPYHRTRRVVKVRSAVEGGREVAGLLFCLEYTCVDCEHAPLSLGPHWFCMAGSENPGRFAFKWPLQCKFLTWTKPWPQTKGTVWVTGTRTEQPQLSLLVKEALSPLSKLHLQLFGGITECLNAHKAIQTHIHQPADRWLCSNMIIHDGTLGVSSSPCYKRTTCLATCYLRNSKLHNMF